MHTSYQDIKKAVIKSQHCQRNFDLSKEIPEDDLNLIIHAATNCPSKQNISFYDLIVIRDKDLISSIHQVATGVDAYDKDGNFVPTTNSQTLANVLFVFVRKELSDMTEFASTKWRTADEAEVAIFERDRNVAIGIAAGYTNVVSSLLGYSTGCCQCFQTEKIREMLGIERTPELLMGIGFKDETRNRREHATDENLIFPTRTKEKIEVSFR